MNTVRQLDAEFEARYAEAARRGFPVSVIPRNIPGPVKRRVHRPTMTHQKSVARMQEIIAAFRAAGKPLTRRQLADRLGLSDTGVQHYLHELLKRGWLTLQVSFDTKARKGCYVYSLTSEAP